MKKIRKIKMFKINIVLTSSKILAYVIVILGTIYSFITKNSEVIIFAYSLAAGLHGLKNWNDTRIKSKQLDQINSNSNGNDNENGDDNCDNSDVKTKPIKKPDSEIG